jgi:molybdenum cofactor cytidylyltransferase
VSPRSGTDPRVAAIVLAAGASRRLGAAKQLLREADGGALLVRLVRDALEAGCAPVVVVLGANAEEVSALLRSSGLVAARSESMARDPVARVDVQLVLNPDWSLGLASSLRCGLSALEEGECTAALLLACDQPAAGATHFEALLATHAAVGARVASEYAGVLGIPAIWPRDDWAAMRELTGDRGARSLLRGDEARVELVGGALDLDTPDDVARWRGTDGVARD